MADGYSSAALGAVNNTGQVNLDLNSGNEQSERVDFIPGDSVVYSSSFAGGGGYIFGFQATDPGTAMATYRLKAAAVRPTPLPEPSQALQLAVGAAMLFALSKRRRASDLPSVS